MERQENSEQDVPGGALETRHAIASLSPAGRAKLKPTKNRSIAFGKGDGLCYSSSCCHGCKLKGWFFRLKDLRLRW